ncbi:MAG: hypothetical protein H7222_05485 [Methylotenera sp.]|nr:hypothetical protein [Oligoflexia bacterium]
MKHLTSWIFSGSIVFLGISAAAANMSSEMMMNAYVSDFATRQLELVLPRGQFSLQVKVTAKKVSGSEAMRLPLGTATLTSDEMSLIEASGTESTGKLLSRIDRVELTVGVGKIVPEAVRALIKSTLSSTMALQESRGDSVKLVDLPEGYSLAWNPPTEPKSPPQAERTTLSAVEWTLCGIAGAFLLISLGIIYLSFRQMGTRLSTEARAMATVIKDAADSNSGGGSFQNAPVASQAVTPLAATSRGKPGDSDESFWTKIDIDSIVAFCVDCLDHPQYRSIPGLLIDSLLESERSTEVQNHLVSKEYEAQALTGTQYQTREVNSLFQSHQPEYRRSGRSPMAKQLLLVPFEKMQELVKSSSPVQSAMIINSLTPLRRSMVLKDLTVDYKLELSAFASKPMSMVEHKTAELELTSTLEKFSHSRPKEAQFHSMSYLSQVILKAESFSEDEQFHLTARNGRSNYVSVLKSFDVFTADDWSTENLQELAIAFCGYSTEVKARLTEKFTGKRQDWFRNFMSKFASSNPDFSEFQVVQVQDRIKARIAALTSSSENILRDEKNAAA